MTLLSMSSEVASTHYVGMQCIVLFRVDVNNVKYFEDQWEIVVNESLTCTQPNFGIKSISLGHETLSP